MTEGKGMKKKIKVSASILSADFTKLGNEIKKCEGAGVDMIHVDVMDGHFVPVISIGQVIVQAIRPTTKLPLDVHLMVEHPGMQIGSFLGAGADNITVPAECYGRLREGCRELGQYPKEVDSIDIEAARRDLLRIKEGGAKAFISINPGSSLCMLPLLDILDGVLVMSVNPGFSGQKFMPEVLPKIRELGKSFNGDILVDGGLNEETSREVVNAGANIIVTASYFFGSGDFVGVVKYLKGLS